MQKKVSFKLFAFLLSILLFISSLPVLIVAIETKNIFKDSSFSTQTKQLSNENEFKQPSSFMNEIHELREENVKHFDIGDGNRIAVSYGVAIHRKDRNGEWQDIDNTLAIKNDQGEKRYCSSNGRVSFASSMSQNSNSIWSLSESGYTVSFSLAESDCCSNAKAEVANHLAREKQVANAEKSGDREAVLRVDNRTTVHYSDVIPNVDFEYILYGNNIKENILVKAPGERYDFSFRLTMSNLIPKETENGAILLHDAKNGNAIYCIPAPYMIDAKFEQSKDVVYSMEKIAEDQYELTISASPDWINAPERSFPVSIDPTLSSTTAGTFDTYFDSTNSTTQSTPYGSSSVMWVSSTQTAFVKSTTLPHLPDGAVVIQANLVAAYYYYSGVTGRMKTYTYRSTKSWNESTSTWNTMSNNGSDPSLGLPSVSLGVTYLETATSYPQWASFTITSAARHWYNGTTSATHENYGIAIVRKSGNNSVILHTYEAFNGYTSYFTITYTPRINDGVYSLSKQNTNTYATSNTINGGTNLSQTIYTNSPLNEANRIALFKIKYRALTNDYVIRSMTNNDIIIYPDGDLLQPFTVRMPGVADSEVPNEKAWNIEATSDGYYFISTKINNTKYYLNMPSTGYLTLITTSPSTAKWCFSKYTGSTFRGWGQMNSWPEHIDNGSDATIEAYIYSTVMGENSAWINSSVIDPFVAEATPLSNHAQMKITPKYGGNTKIQIEASSNHIVFGTYYLMSGWDSGSFFIQNVYSSDYLAEMDGVSDSELRLVSLPNGTDKEYTLWNMIYCGQGYYKIVQDIIGDCIYGNHPTTYNLRGKPWANDNWQEILWKFIPQPDGSFKIQSYYNVINNPNNYVSLDSTSTKNIRSLANTGSKQLWNVKPLMFHTSVLYDQAFIDRHSETGHLNVLNEVFGINEAGKSIETNLRSQLGYHLNLEYVSTSFNPYNSLPYQENCRLLDATQLEEICNNPNPNSNQYVCSCTDTTNQLENCEAGYHHKNGNRMLGEMTSISPTSSTNARILFTGFDCCNICYNEHTPSSFIVLGWTNRAATKSLIMDNGSGIRRTAQHELVHILGAPDCGNLSGQDCIMGHHQTLINVINNMIICNSCVNSIKELKYQFYQH